jgi:hypothetical protein
MPPTDNHHEQQGNSRRRRRRRIGKTTATGVGKFDNSIPIQTETATVGPG